MSDEIALPNLILLSEYGGNVTDYFEAVYQVFKQDFVDSRPTYRGRRLGLKKYPITDGREKTFYHLTHEGPDEENRSPDMRRMERIPFPRPIIDCSEYSCVKVWENKRKTQN